MLTIRVVRAPHTALPEEFDALAAEPDVELSFVDRPDELGVPDMVVLPGSEATIPDLMYLRESGMKRAIRRAAEGGSLLFGVCGGFQMMGRTLEDPEGVEGDVPHALGLGVFDLTTTFTRHKIDEPVEATAAPARPDAAPGFLARGEKVSGFELHRGRSVLQDDGAVPLFVEWAKGGSSCPLAVATKDYSAVGTYLHGVLADPVFRRRILEHLRERRHAIENG